MRKSKKEKLRDAALKKRKHYQHIAVFTVLGIAILVVQIFMPSAITLVTGGILDLSHNIEILATEGTVALLAVAAGVYAWKAIFK